MHIYKSLCNITYEHAHSVSVSLIRYSAHMRAQRAVCINALDAIVN
jgi:hypothetical protein